jgi:ankyrin repeat protein
MKDRSGQTALNYAVYNGHSKIVAALLDHGADIESKNSKSNV